MTNTFDEYLIETNTFRSDVNEILLAYYCVNDGDKFHDWENVSRLLKDRESRIKSNEYNIEKNRAHLMAEQILLWTKENGYKKDIAMVWWVSRPGELQTITGLDDPSNPSDILLQFEGGRYLGISAKSTKGSREIVFRNPGLGSVDIALDGKFKELQLKAEAKFIEKYSLSDSPIVRKDQIRDNPLILQKANHERTRILQIIRNNIFKKMDLMPQHKLRKVIIDFWMGIDQTENPELVPYIKVTGHGIKDKYHVTILNPKEDPKLEAAQNRRIKLFKSGNETICVKAGDINILRIRAKYGAVPLAAPIEFSVDPWSGKKDII